MAEKRTLIFAVPIYFDGIVQDVSADDVVIDDAYIVYETGVMSEAMAPGGKWKFAEIIGDGKGVRVLRGTIIAMKEYRR